MALAMQPADLPRSDVAGDGDGLVVEDIEDIGVDAAVAAAWGRLSAIRSVPVIDALLAATAAAHRLVLVTRNTADVAGLGVQLLNPFDAARN